MGGAAGHMAHPFDLPEVDTGTDLVAFFKKAADYVHNNEASVKIDGVNVSFKLVNGPNGISGEWGHIPIGVPNNKNNIEEFISGKGLERLYYSKYKKKLIAKEIFKNARNDSKDDTMFWNVLIALASALGISLAINVWYILTSL